METLRVYAVPGRCFPALDSLGRSMTGRWVGCTPAGVPIPEGVEVPAVSHYVRALRRGDLSLSPPAPAAPPPASSPSLAPEGEA